MTQACPIFGAAVRENPRYPDYLCQPGARRTVDAEGPAVTHHNTFPSSSNLIESPVTTYADGSRYMSQDCYVDGVGCRADEARFGGIVVRPRAKREPWH